MKYMVCNKWLVEIPDIAQDSDVYIKSRPYTHYLRHKQYDIAVQSWCYEYLLDMLSGVDSVVEYFAGVGIDTAIITNMLMPTSLTLIDLNMACVDVLKANYPDANVMRGDFMQLAGIPCDLAVMDMNQFTALRHYSDPQLQYALERALPVCEVAILADSAISRLHLNLSSYSRVLLCDVTDMASYMAGMSAMFLHMYGYGISVVAYHVRAAYMLLEHNYSGPLECVRAPVQARDWFRAIDE